MKIRMLGNSIRLRLSQTDMETLATEGRILERVDFGSTALQYGIEIIDGDEIQASLADHVLLVKIPRTDAQPWLDTEQVGISHTITPEGAPEMSVLLKKTSLAWCRGRMRRTCSQIRRRTMIKRKETAECGQRVS